MTRSKSGGKPNDDGAVSTVIREPRQVRRWAVVALGLVLVGALIGWAATTVLSPSAKVPDAAKFTFVKVVEGEVGSSINLNTVAEWKPAPIGWNRAVGVVTSVNAAAGTEVGPGAVLYTVNLRPVVIAQGTVPAFEAMSSGASGADVAQLQTMLKTLGFFSDDVDGEFGYYTARAVEAWQKSLGVDPDGVVQQADIIFVPALPTRVALDPTVLKIGASLVGGEELVTGLPTSPVFTIPVTQLQAALMPTNTKVEIVGPKGEEWEGLVIDQTISDTNGVTVKLDGKDGASVCGEQCGDIPVTGQTLLRSRVVTVETVTGLTVPSASLLSHVDGTLTVIDKDGVEHTVIAVTSARGMSVITGVAEGLMVRVPGVSG